MAKRSRRGSLRNRLDVVKADVRGDWVYVRTKDGKIHEIAIMPRGHYRTRSKITPGKRSRSRSRSKK